MDSKMEMACAEDREVGPTAWGVLRLARGSGAAAGTERFGQRHCSLPTLSQLRGDSGRNAEL